MNNNIIIKKMLNYIDKILTYCVIPITKNFETIPF